MKKAAPYAAFGAFKSLSENWELLSDAYNNRESFSKALTRTGADFAGYTVTPMLIDGVLTLTGKKAALAVSLKNAGMGYTLGVSLWEAGREYFAYSLGEIPSEEFYNRAGRIAARTVEEIVSVNVIGYLVSCTGYTMLVPVVIFAGQNIIQRTHSWYEDKQKERQWLNTVYLDDITKILGEDLINTFTIINSETRPSLANPFTRPSLAK